MISEREEVGSGERETETEKHQSVASDRCLDQGSNLQLFGVWDDAPTNHASQGTEVFFKSYLYVFINKKKQETGRETTKKMSILFFLQIKEVESRHCSTDPLYH